MKKVISSVYVFVLMFGFVIWFDAESHKGYIYLNKTGARSTLVIYYPSANEAKVIIEDFRTFKLTPEKLIDMKNRFINRIPANMVSRITPIKDTPEPETFE